MMIGRLLHQPGGRLLALAVAAVIVVGMCVSMLQMAERLHKRDDTILDMMPSPVVDIVMPLPKPSFAPVLQQGEAVDAQVEAWLANPQMVGLELPAPVNGVSVAWGAAISAQDVEKKPLPILYPADRYLEIGKITAGASVALRGYLLDADTTEGGWQRGVIRLDDSEHYGLVVLPPGAPLLDIGQPVQGVGRFLGHIPHEYEAPVDPVATDGEDATKGAVENEQATVKKVVQYPVVCLRSWQAVAGERSGPSLDGLVAQWAQVVDLWKPNVEVWQHIDDDSSVFDLAPYYHALGLMAYDRAYPEANAAGLEDDSVLDANTYANVLHHEPWDYRKRRIAIEGRVYRAWYDSDVQRDRPFGVDRVMRVQMWNTVYGVERTLIDRQGEEIQVNNPFLAVYEVAVLMDEEQPLPEFGDRVEVEGRFVRMQGHRAEENPKLDEKMGFYRQSGNIYFRFATAYADQFTNLGPIRRGGFRWFYIPVFAAALIFMAISIYLVMSERNPQQARKRIFIRARRRTRKSKQDQSEKKCRGPEGPRPE